jgi:hypothetical protein
MRTVLFDCAFIFIPSVSLLSFFLTLARHIKGEYIHVHDIKDDEQDNDNIIHRTENHLWLTWRFMTSVDRVIATTALLICIV